MNPECKLSYCESADEWKDCLIISDDGEPQIFAKLNSIRHCTSEEYENHDYIEYRVSYVGKSALWEYGVSCTYNDGSAELEDAVVFDDNTLVIPDDAEGIPVVSISTNLSSAIRGVKRIKIGKNVKTIPKDFIDSINGNSLRIVDIGDGVEIIEKNAFPYLGALASVSFGKNIKEIGESAFVRCNRLQSTIDLPNIV